MRCSSRWLSRAQSHSTIGWSAWTRRGIPFNSFSIMGYRKEADIVIGADGISSKVREYLLGDEAPRFVGSVAHRAIFPTERLRGFKIPDCTKWWGLDRHVLPYFMTSRRDELYVIGVVPASKWEGDAASIASVAGSNDRRFLRLSSRFAPRPGSSKRREPLANFRSRTKRLLERSDELPCSAMLVIRCALSWQLAVRWRWKMARSSAGA